MDPLGGLGICSRNITNSQGPCIPVVFLLYFYYILWVPCSLGFRVGVWVPELSE